MHTHIYMHMCIHTYIYIHTHLLEHNATSVYTYTSIGAQRHVVLPVQVQRHVFLVGPIGYLCQYNTPNTLAIRVMSV